MKKLYIIILLILNAVQFVTAQQPYVTIKGHVYNRETRAPVAGQTIIIVVDSLNSSGYQNKVVTDITGFYSDKIQFKPGSSKVAISVSTYDCNGSLLTSTAYAYLNSLDVTLDFLVCGKQAPECVAKFKTQPASNDLLSLFFMDGSYTSYGANLFNYFWDFGDGTISTDKSLLHTFNKPGVYNVCLKIVNSNDSTCRSSFCLPVQVGSIIPDPCENSFVYYNDSTGKGYVFIGSVTNGQADAWYWDFGDGTRATGPKVSHTFPSPDKSYKVCLTTTGLRPEGSTCKAYSCQVVTVKNPSLCETSFSYSPDASGSGQTFEGYAKNNQIKSWTWDFGDGTFANGQKVSHTFSGTNTNYKVCLTTTGSDSNGSDCKYSSCQDVEIYVSSPCNSSFTYSTNAAGSGYIFEGYSKNNQIKSWNWDFGDGTTATGQKVTHSFNISNKTGYYVCLTTTNLSPYGDSCSFISCQQVYIYPPTPCKNYFKAYTENGSDYTFSGDAASGEKAYYYWNFGDGTIDTGQVVKHTFGKIYTVFDVCLTTIAYYPGSTGFYECKSISCQSIYNGVDSSMCIAVFSAVPNSTKNTYQFNNLSKSNSKLIYWDFGDGNNSTEINPVHTYSSPGIYKACLTIADNMRNCKDQSCQEIWVNIIQSGCKASFYKVPLDSIADSGKFQFINTSTEGIYSNIKWSFGDGTGSAEFNPIHTYSTPGVYTACLTIWDSLSKCNSNYCMDVYAGKVIKDNTISGIVTMGNKAADEGLIWLIGHDNEYNDQKSIDLGGKYHFTGVPSGKFYIYAMLTPGSDEFFAYMPTYYPGSLSWQGATLITTSEPNSWYPIKLITTNNVNQGIGTISGAINWSGKSKEDGSPAVNIEVVLYDSNGSPMAYTFTNSDGTFEFNNLPYGKYTLQAEMPGKATQLIEVSLSENNFAINIDFRINEEAIYFLGIDNQNKTRILAGNPYPNPVIDILTLELNIPVAGNATVEVIDMQGRIIHRELTGLVQGQNQILLQTNNFKKGIYQLRIKTDGQKPVQRRFVR